MKSNSKRVRINSDKTLTVTVNENEFSFESNDYLKSDKGKILLKHGSVLRLAEVFGVILEEPKLVVTHGTSTYVISRTAKHGNATHTAIGESNKANLFDSIMQSNPATTADNRACERAILSVLGLYGELYGASEINFKDNGNDGDKPSPVSKETAKNNTESTDASPDENSPEDDAPVQGESDVENKEPEWWSKTGVGEYKESELNPETCIVTLGPQAGKNWTVKQLYDYDYKGCLYFASRRALDTAKDDLRKQVYSCRRAIRQYGMRAA